MRAHPLAVLAALLLPVAVAGAATEEDARAGPDAVLARVGERTITIDDFTAEIERRSAFGDTVYATMEQRETLLDEMVRTESVVAAALDAGYDKDPEFLAAVRRILVARYVEDHLQQRLEGLSVSEAEVRREFENHRATYSRPERVKGAMIFLELGPRATEEQIAATAERAEALRREAEALTEVTHLGELALKNSDDRATRYTGGVLPWLARGAETKWGSAVVDALFAIDEVGGVAPVVRTGSGFYVLRLVDREAAEELPYQMYAAGIRRQILRRKQDQERAAFYRELEAMAGVVVNRQKLADVPGLQTVPDAEDAARPPAVPGK